MFWEEVYFRLPLLRPIFTPTPSFLSGSCQKLGVKVKNMQQEKKRKKERIGKVGGVGVGVEVGGVE